eukprot:11593356-Alexandrium_andersonii.AAC.1
MSASLVGSEMCIRDSFCSLKAALLQAMAGISGALSGRTATAGRTSAARARSCLLYTSPSPRD